MTPRLVWPVALALACVVYWTGLSGPFVFDDTYNLLPINEWLNGERGWASVLSSGAVGSTGRPIAMGSFMLNVALLGPDTWSLKLVNLLLHLLNGTLVYTLFRGFAANGGLTKSAPQALRWFPIFAASLWLLHPLLVSTVLYVIQRMAMLSAMFTLLAMLAFLQGRVLFRTGLGRRATLLLSLVPMLMLLATLSKENGILAIPLCGLIEWSLFAPPNGERRSRRSVIFIGTTIVLPILAVLLLTIISHPIVVDGYSNRPFTLTERLLTQPRVLWDYISSLVLPAGPKLGLYHDDYPVSHSLVAPVATSVAIAGWLVVIAVAWRTRKAIPGLALGLGIFLIGQALESSVFPLLMYFEHRNYLPAVGALWAIVSVLCWLGQRVAPRMHHGPRVFRFAAASIVVVFALATAARAGVWHSEKTLLSQGLTYHPDSRWLRMDIAQWAMKQHPPLADVARTHMEYLATTSDGTNRRVAGAMRLLIDCTTNTPARPVDLTRAFGGTVDPLEADLLLAFERLADAAASDACNELPALRVATQMDAMLDRSSLSRREYNLRRLRFKSAQLYVKAGNLDLGLAQAKLAYLDGNIDAPIPVLIAQIEIARGNFPEAIRMLDAATAKVSKDDTLGKQFIAGMQAQIRDNRKISPGPQ